jgi:hypothetical protein
MTVVDIGLLTHADFMNVTKQTAIRRRFILFYYYLFNKFTYLLPSFVFDFIWAFFSRIVLFIG